MAFMVVVSAGAELSVADACGSVVVEPSCRDGMCWTVACAADGASWDVSGTVAAEAWGAWSVEPSMVLLRWASSRDWSMRLGLLGGTAAGAVAGGSEVAGPITAAVSDPAPPGPCERPKTINEVSPTPQIAAPITPIRNKLDRREAGIIGASGYDQ